MLTWSTFGLNNIICPLSLPILLIEEEWLDLILVLGWYLALLPPAIHIWPTLLLESTLVLTRYCHHQPPQFYKWKSDDRLDLNQDVEQGDPSRRAMIQ